MRDWERIFLRLMLFMGEGELLVILFKLFVLADFFGGDFRLAAIFICPTYFKLLQLLE